MPSESSSCRMFAAAGNAARRSSSDTFVGRRRVDDDGSSTPAILTVGSDNSEVALAREEGVGAGDAVEEEQALQVVELVLQGAGLEGVRLDPPLLTRPRHATHDDDGRRPYNVAGQVRHRQAALPSYLLAIRGLEHRRAQ